MKSASKLRLNSRWVTIAFPLITLTCRSCTEGNEIGLDNLIDLHKAIMVATLRILFSRRRLKIDSLIISSSAFPGLKVRYRAWSHQG